MNVTSTAADIHGLAVIETRVFKDDRGWFAETFNELEYAAAGINSHFVQDNLSCSRKGVLRGLHFQNPPYAQGKLVRVLRGAVLDVAVDLRSASPTYGRHYKILLSGENNKALWIPPGFAHGFVSLEEDTLFHYKCTNYYHPESEFTLMWNDPDLGIDWETGDPAVSPKDRSGAPFAGFKSLF